MKMMDVFLSMIAVLYISISLFPVVVNRVDANYVTIPRTFNGCALAFLSRLLVSHNKNVFL